MKVYLAIGTFVTLATGLVGNAKLPAWGERLGWTLIHSLWQVTLIAAVALVVNTGLRRWSAQTRYVVGVLFLGLMLIVPGVTWTTIAITPLANEVNRTKHPERTNTPTNGAASNRGAFSLADVGAAINPSRENTLPMDLAPAPSLVADRMIQPISAADSSASLTQEMPPDQKVLQSISRM